VPERSEMKSHLPRMTVLALILTPQLAFAQTIALRGTLVTPASIINDGFVTVNDSTITLVQPWVERDTSSVTKVVAVDGIIFPGLIDLHNHVTWNAFPRWKPPTLSKNRYEWQEMPEYAASLSRPHGDLSNHGYDCDLNRYGELKVIANGGTSTVGSIRNECIRGLARNLDFLSELSRDEQPGGDAFRNEIFPLEIRSSCGEQAMRDVGRALEPCALSPQETMPVSPRAAVAHVAEGIDASTRREFSMFAAHGYLHPGISIIHGVGLRSEHFKQMASSGVGLIWSPRSNMELYGQTTDVVAARNAGVTVAVAPDWSPSGSTGMLAELRYIDRWQRDASNRPPFNFSSKELVEMATIVPARLARLEDKLGKLESGYMADLIAMKRPAPAADATPYDALAHQTPSDLLLVMVGGVALFGEPGLMNQLVPDHAQLESVTICGETRLVNAQAGTYTGVPWAETEARLVTALKPYGITLAPFVECTP